jgi:hypothetical protein
MTNQIICPNCKHAFEPTDSMRAELETELRGKMVEWQKQKDEDFKKREQALQQALSQKDVDLNKRLLEERQQLEQTMRKTMSADFENQIKLLQQNLGEQEEKLKTARQKELEALQKEQALKDKEAELELRLNRQLLEERAKLKELVMKEEAERNLLKEQEFLLRNKELEKQIEDQKKLVDEMKRKAEQGSMQLQGEVAEILLENMLREAFPYDVVSEVGKGVRGADCIQLVRNQFGQDCGSIIFESKRTKEFHQDWIEKVKKDMRANNADVAVIVTQVLPRDLDRFGEKDGVYICTFAEVKSLVMVLRNSLLKVFAVAKSQENRGEKMQMLYGYLTGNEFSEQWKAIREGFMSMKMSIQKERDAMEKLWKAREKQLEKVLLNAAHIKGSIEGISGSDGVDLSLEDEDQNLLLE